MTEAFGETPYLVGSVARAERQYRDVDVRMRVPHGAWMAESRLRLRAVNLSVTLWGRQVTGLPIDFQFQPDGNFRAEDGGRRSALGISTRVAVDDASNAGPAGLT